MKLKVKNFKWLAGRPVVILHEKTAKKMNVFQNDRVALTNSHNFYAVVDIFAKLVKENEIGLSTELTKIFKSKNGSSLDVNAAEISPASKLIKKKIDGGKLNEKELETIIDQIVKNNLTEAEIAYFISSQKMAKMTIEETVNLTKAMIKTGTKLKFANNKKVVDKHCIGGVAGNRTTPIVVSICAAAGLISPKTSSRAITSASGTADVIETVSNVELNLKDLNRVIKKTGACLAWGGSLKLAPSDDKIIRVERLIGIDVESQLLASIMSKKISAGSKYILVDIPYGQGAKIDTKLEAKKLGKKFKQLSKHFDVKLEVVYTNGFQPVGHGIGPVLEMIDVLNILENKPDASEYLRKKSLFLASKLMNLAGIKNSKKKAQEILKSGKAYKKFREIIDAQNGNSKTFDSKVKSLKVAKFQRTIIAQKTGRIKTINNKKINHICRILGTPETISAGIYLEKHTGKVKKGEKLMTMYSENKAKLDRAYKYYKKEKVMEIK